jgi:hypothetical protein
MPTVLDSSVMLALEYERQWLIQNPHFEERPATIIEFLGPQYLNIEKYVRPAVRDVLIDLFGTTPSPDRISKYQRGIFTGAIGIGKTTLASIVIPYMAHWVLCLRDPQSYYGLMPGSRIAFMQMSTSGPQAKEVVFGDIKARLEKSPWFQNKYPPDKTFKNQIRFEQKDIWILPGDSAETTFEGYNILGGILDEIDSHKKTKVKDYAEQGYTTIHGRITSRFEDRGFILLVGQMKSASGFASKMFKDMKQDPNAYVCRLTIWQSLGWQKWTNPDGVRDSFWYDIKRYSFTTQAHAELLGHPEHILEVPNVYRRDFMNSPMKALRDLAGMPPAVNAPFIHDASKIDLSRMRWAERTQRQDGPVAFNPSNRTLDKLADWFTNDDNLKRVMHIDVAYSGEGDALGMCMGHVPELVRDPDGEIKPFIMIDFLIRIKAPPGREIVLSDIRQIVYDLRFNRRFKIVTVSMDGFESTEMRQQLNKKRIATDYVSMDRTMLPYQDLYDALMEERIAIPPYLTLVAAHDTDPIDILYKELTELQEMDNGKIDHPPDGSKDLADSLAGVVTKLMSHRGYQRRSLGDDQRADTGSTDLAVPTVSSAVWNHPAVNNNFSPGAPVPPSFIPPTQWRPPKR